MENIDVVRKLLGRIEPVADSAIDKERLSNLHETIEVVENLLSDIYLAAQNKNSQEHSVKEIGLVASKFLTNLYGEEV